ncbi:glycosylphosphatidylinositol anchor biosynthesis [Gurleya vavrai]
MDWRKVLYKKQNYPRNFMVFEKEKEIEKTLNNNDINRFLQSVMSIFIFFAIYKLIPRIDINSGLYALFLVVVLLAFKIIKKRKNFKKFINLSSLIVIWIFLMSQIILSLTKEISTDTIYIFYIILKIIYCIDNVKCAILNESEDTDERNLEERPLSLEDTYTNFRKNNISTLGYSCSILGSIMLCSRYSSIDEVFLHLCTNFSWFFLFPMMREFFDLQKSYAFSFILYCLGMILTYYAGKVLFLTYCSVILYVYGFVFVLAKIMHLFDI